MILCLGLSRRHPHVFHLSLQLYGWLECWWCFVGLNVGGVRVGLIIGGTHVGLNVGGIHVGLIVCGNLVGLNVGGVHVGLIVGGVLVGLNLGGAHVGLNACVICGS